MVVVSAIEQVQQTCSANDDEIDPYLIEMEYDVGEAGGATSGGGSWFDKIKAKAGSY